MRKIFSNIRSLFNAFVIDRFFNLLSFLIIARLLTEADYGIFSIALAFGGVFAFLGDFGISNTLIREVNNNFQRRYIYLTSFLKIKAIFAVISIILSLVIASLLYEGDIVFYTSVLTISMVIGNTMFTTSKSFYQAIQEMKYISRISFVSSLVTFIGVIVLLLNENDEIFLVICVYGLSKVIGGLLALYVLRNHLKHCLIWEWESVLLKGLFSFSIGGILILLISQVPTILIGKLSTLEKVGIFSIAHRIPLLIYTLPGIVAGSYYPQLFKFKKRKVIHIKLVANEMKLLFIISGIICLPFLIDSDFIVEILFGQKWIQASPILKTLIFLVILQSINFPLGDALSTSNLQSKRNLAYSLGLITILTGFLFIANYTDGELIYYAYIMVFSEIVTGFIMLFYLKTYIKTILFTLYPYLVVFFSIFVSSHIILNFSGLFGIFISEIFFISILIFLNKKNVSKFFKKVGLKFP